MGLRERIRSLTVLLNIQPILTEISSSIHMSSGAGDDAILNLAAYDPFHEASKGDAAGSQSNVIHIRIQQRNGRKTLTTVQGISDDYDKKKIAKACKKQFCCNGTVVDHPEWGEVLQMQGDQRNNIANFLVEVGLAKKNQLKVHGF